MVIHTADSIAAPRQGDDVGTAVDEEQVADEEDHDKGHERHPTPQPGNVVHPW